MPEIPPETVTEEQYTDEHGHTVVKKVLSAVPLATFLLSCKGKDKYSHVRARCPLVKGQDFLRAKRGKTQISCCI